MALDIKRISIIIAAEINAKPEQAAAAIGLLDEGATVPFVARYRKEVTGGLDDTQLRLLSERLVYLREFDARRDAILNSIREQGKLTDELEAKLAAAVDKAGKRGGKESLILLDDLALVVSVKNRTVITAVGADRMNDSVFTQIDSVVIAGGKDAPTA